MKDKKSADSGKGAHDAPSVDLPIVEHPSAPEVYADHALFFALRGGHNVSITFSSIRLDNTIPGVLGHVVIGRLVMPVAGAIGLANEIQRFLRNHGLVPDKAGAN